MFIKERTPSHEKKRHFHSKGFAISPGEVLIRLFGIFVKQIDIVRNVVIRAFAFFANIIFYHGLPSGNTE